MVVGAFGHREASDDPRLRDYFGEADLAVVGEARELAAGVASHLGIEQYLPSAKPQLAAMNQAPGVVVSKKQRASNLGL